MLRSALHIMLWAACSSAGAGVSGYYRSPALHGDTLVFTAEGDLYRASVSGGVASRLTSHAAEESQAAISPDGRWLAFVAAYDGPSEIYVMPLSGGPARRLTADGGRVWMIGFTPSGQLAYATENVVGPSWQRISRLADPETGRATDIPLLDAGDIAFSADGKTLWFTRFGLGVTGDNARRYRGGAMSQLWRYRDGDAEAVRLPDAAEGGYSHPMRWREQLVAVAESNGVDNLWLLGGDGSAAKVLTAHTDFGVRGASIDGDRVVYQHGADLRLYDLGSGSDTLIPLSLHTDVVQRRARFSDNGAGAISSVQISADGQSATLTSRGTALVLGLGKARRVDVQTAPGARLREAIESVDGKLIYAITDIDGRSEIWSYPADGGAGGKPLVADTGVYRWRLTLSPDGKYLVHDDKAGQLWLLTLATGDNRLLDQSLLGGDDGYSDIVFSPGSSAIAYVRADSKRSLPQIILQSLSDKTKTTLTSDRYESFAPAFSSDGRWLYFLSNRNFSVAQTGGPWGDRNTGPFFDARARLYALALQPGNRFAFAPKDDSADESAGDKAAPAIVFEGIAERLFEAPLPPGNYSALRADAERLYFLERGTTPAGASTLKSLKIEPENAKAETFASDVLGYQLSADAKTLLLIKPSADPKLAGAPGALQLLPVGIKAPDDVSKQTIDLSGLTLRIQPNAEWAQMFDDAWSMHRHFSFDPAMRGVDWNAVRSRYANLLPRVSERNELDDLLGQMTAELGILHSQLRGGDARRDVAAVDAAALGAVLNEVDDGVRIVRRYRSDPELPSARSPLAQPGVDVQDGDVIVAVNGRAVRTRVDLAEQLIGQSGKTVQLTLRRGSRDKQTLVTPVSLGSDATLRYGDWVEGNRLAVNAADADLGYLHLRAMGPNDINNFVREFYAQFDRDGLIIDVRRNRGGNIDSWIIEKLLRRTWAFWATPGAPPNWNMQQTFRGHLVVLADPLTYSDGETFTAGVKALSLGTVIGQRTAGAGIWLSDRNRLVDGGQARVAEFGQYDAQGRWLIEGNGVAPDIAVDNPPHASYAGDDAQLRAAIAHLQRQLKEKPIAPAVPQPIPAVGTPGHDGSKE